MTTAERPVTRLLVCGNVDRCDDGAAIWATSHLRAVVTDELNGVEMRRCGQLDIDDLLDAPGPTIIVDTAVGVPPGHVVTLTFDDLMSATHGPVPHSSHALPIDQVIGVSRQLSRDPIDGLFVGIGAADVGFGQALSQPVREHMGDFVGAIRVALLRVSSTTATAVS